VLSTILSQLCLSREHLKICGGHDFALALETFIIIIITTIITNIVIHFSYFTAL